jgi:hypothetical protein
LKERGRLARVMQIPELGGGPPALRLVASFSKVFIAFFN